MLKDNKLISHYFAETILADHEVKNFLMKTKDFVFPENAIKNEDVSDDEMESVSVEERYVNYLSKLNHEELESALKNFSVHLAAKGTNIKVEVLDTQKYQQTKVK